MMSAIIILAIDTVGAIYYDMIIGRCAGAVPWHILWVPCGGHSIYYGYISIYRSGYRDNYYQDCSLLTRVNDEIFRVDFCASKVFRIFIDTAFSIMIRIVIFFKTFVFAFTANKIKFVVTYKWTFRRFVLLFLTVNFALSLFSNIIYYYQNRSLLTRVNNEIFRVDFCASKAFRIFIDKAFSMIIWIIIF